LILLVVGYSLGRRPVGPLRAELDSRRTSEQKRIATAEKKAALAEARGYLWQARAELLLASLEVERTNFGTAAERTRSAEDLIVRAAGVAGLGLNLDEAQQLVEAAAGKIADLDGEAKGALENASNLLGRLLEEHQA